jgi:hypothetical protein
MNSKVSNPRKQNFAVATWGKQEIAVTYRTLAGKTDVSCEMAEGTVR